jgi:hypothetical protein
MCCGHKRAALRNSAAAGTTPTAAEDEIKAQAASMNLYYLRNVPIRLRGSVTGRPRDFSSARPVQASPFGESRCDRRSQELWRILSWADKPSIRYLPTICVASRSPSVQTYSSKSVSTIMA